MKIVYLDQWVWIKLAKAAYGRRDGSDLVDTLRLLQSLKETHLVCFPLSIGHYMETQEHTDARRRARLAQVMLDLSDGKTLLNPTFVLDYEIEQALFRLFPGRIRAERLRSFNFLGDGIGHALGIGPLTDVVLARSFARHKLKVSKQFERSAKAAVEHSLPSFVDPLTGLPAETPDLGPGDKKFKEHLDIWSAAMQGKDAQTRQRMLYAGTLRDVWIPLTEALHRHGLAVDDFAVLGEDAWCAFLEDMPSRRVDMHLHRQWGKNESLPHKESDLNDWVFLGDAVMYCHIVVAEKQFTDLVRRDGFSCPARVIDDIRELPGLLVNLG
jgi:hypothetical protein